MKWWCNYSHIYIVKGGVSGGIIWQGCRARDGLSGGVISQSSRVTRDGISSGVISNS